MFGVDDQTTESWDTTNRDWWDWWDWWLHHASKISTRYGCFNHPIQQDVLICATILSIILRCYVTTRRSNTTTADGRIAAPPMGATYGCPKSRDAAPTDEDFTVSHEGIVHCHRSSMVQVEHRRWGPPIYNDGTVA